MKPVTRTFYADAAQRVIERIVRNLDDALDLGTLANEACLSAFHFHRVFRGMVGETPLELARRLRMERAAWRLVHDGGAITEVAFDAGYETHEAFTRAFRECYSTSPSGFRLRKHPRTALAASCGVHFTDDGPVPLFIPRDSGGRTMDVEITNMPDLRVAAVRHVGPYNQIPVAFERLGSIAGPTGLFGQPGAVGVAIYYDDPESISLDQLRSDAGVVVPDGIPLPAGLTEQHIPAGRYARTRHVGPYEQLPDTWMRFMGEWLPNSGYRLGPGTSCEIYRNDAQTTPKDRLITDIYISIV